MKIEISKTLVISLVKVYLDASLPTIRASGTDWFLKIETRTRTLTSYDLMLTQELLKA